MSSAASWSYTAAATLWPLLGRDDWTGAATYGAPQVIACDYSAEVMRMTDAKGEEFISRQQIFTERAGVEPGDMILIGVSVSLDPITAGAAEVRAVTRWGDTLDRQADDYRIST
ncbi:hypothetical protein [Pseudacidovorax intermedius]|uniref:Uncharacterized protein n=1 Tax=Pseudacidovorax intermedius TaxID=433924 RepID=A0A147GQE4_9BURK|nr:hypothetical protein [Pseudacidovorax intermedius]KTT17962.1 hypothetical protein NS331_16515 [Pseudacidovorax intermedius]